MSALLIYMVKAALYLAGFYLVYFVFLSKDTKYVRNRAFIVISVISAFILPLISLNIKEQSSIFYFGKTMAEVLVTATGHKGQIVSASGISLSASSFLFKIYLTGVIVFTSKLLTDIINLLILISRNGKKNYHIIYFNGFNTAGFSAMGYIFINRSLGNAEADEIIRHEQNHLDYNHFLDILFIEVVMIFQWFNPVIYLFNRSLRAIHEYQADQSCIKAGMPVIGYQNLLLSNIFRSHKIQITNSFSNPSLIKKRMIMMTKKRTPALADLKILIVLPLMVLLLAFISACSDADKSSVSQTEISLPPSLPANSPATLSKNIYLVVEEMPVFPGGEQALMEFINKNVVYPKEAMDKNIQGRVILRFAVMATGKVDNVSVLNHVDPLLGKEAKRVIESLPDWIPGRQGGKPANVWYSVPVSFALK